MIQDWRDYIRHYEQDHPHDVVRIATELSSIWEPTALIMEFERMKRYPIVIFEKIRGVSFPVVANLLAERERLARALGVPVEKLASSFAERIQLKMPVETLDEPLFRENTFAHSELDLAKFPILTHFPVDAGPYVTAGLVVARDPYTGVDTCGYHRMQLKGRNRLGISLHSRQRLWEYFRRAEEQGRNLEAAVVLGVHPAISLGSMALVPYDEGKFERIGALMGQALQVARCCTIDVSVPAWAEIVIEGEILVGVREPEGPFAEFTNYSCRRSTENVFVAKSVSHRTDASYQCITPGMSSEHITIVAIQREGDVMQALTQSLPGISKVHAPLSACGLFHCYISLKKIAEGQPMQAIMRAFSVDHNLKMVVVVDEDVDVFDESRVLWAIATRVQADRDVHIIPQHLGMGCTLDPSSDDLSRTSKMGIDATKPLAGFAESITVDVEARKKAESLLSKLLS